MTLQNGLRPSESSAQALDYLRNAIEVEYGGSCLLWIDPSLNDPFEGDARIGDRRISIPIRHPRFDPGLGPYLIPLELGRQDDRDLLSESVEFACRSWTMESLRSCAGHPVAGWVTTREPPTSVASNWASHFLHLRGNLTKLLRWHDPSVREWLWRGMTEQQRIALLGPVERVWSIGRGSHLLEHAGAGRLTAGSKRLELDDQQWFEVEQYATVHAAWLRWADKAPPGAQLVDGWERNVLSALRQASTYGLSAATDRELFALHALRFGSDFHLISRMSPVWERTRAGDFYGSVIEELFECDPTRLDLVSR